MVMRGNNRHHVDNSVHMGIKDMYDTGNMAKNGHISIGRLGEDIASEYLERRGFTIVERNYRKPRGELDIVAQKDGIVHFVEVKAGSWKRSAWPKEGDVVYRPEDHMHAAKCMRMSRAVQSYLRDRKLSPEDEWTADLVVVLINTETRKAQVRVVPNMLLDA